jgi:Phosphoesterase family/Glycosyl hydrolase family 26/Bacterial Ig-like domain (group 3)
MARLPRTAFGGLLCLTLLLASVGALWAKAALASSGASSIPLGDYAGWVNPSGIAAFGSATGSHPTMASDYLDRTDGWSAMDNGGGEGGWAGTGYRLVLGVPIIPGSSGGSLAQGAGGAYNQYFATLAQNLVSEGEANAILRLGWEFNGTWYPWSVASNTDAQHFAAFWRQIVDTMRAVPGAQFSFLWNPNSGGSTSWDLTQAYPGSAYVDYIGTDVYDEYWGTPQTPQNSWNNALTQSWGLNWLASFAASEGRPIALPEWSVCTRSDGHGLGDDPYFINQFANWIATHNVAFTDIFSFNDTAGGQDNDLTHFPNALAAFRADFGGGGGTVPNPTTPTTRPSSTTTTAASTGSTTPSSTTTPHVMVVMMENQGYANIVGNPALPYTNSLASGYGFNTQSYAIAHPSLPNYLSLVSGSNQGVTVDEAPSASGVFDVPTLASQLAGGGFTAKAYADDLPGDPTNDSGLYAVRHFPWEYFANPPPVADASSLVSDLNGGSAPDFVWYTPNLTHDGHTGVPTDTETNELADSEAFLSGLIPSVQATAWYRAGGQIIVEWDEALDSDTSGINGQSGGHVATIVVSANLQGAPQRDATTVDSIGILHSIEDRFGLVHLGGSSGDGTIDALLAAPTAPTPTTTTATPTTRPPAPPASPPATTAPTTLPTTLPTTTTTPSPPTTAPRTIPPTSTTTTPKPVSPTPTTSPPSPATTTPTTSPPAPTTTTTTLPTTTTAPSPPTTSPPASTTTTTVAPVTTPTPTRISLSLVPNAGSSNQDLTATVTPAPEGGTVQFVVDGSELDAVQVSSSSGTASVALELAAGSYFVSASYSGTTSDAPSSTFTLFTVAQTTSILVVSTPVPIGDGQFSLTATLTSHGAPVPGAQVWFAASGSVLCRAPTDSFGHVTCTVGPSEGAHVDLAAAGASATYGGDPTHLPVVAHSPLQRASHGQGHGDGAPGEDQSSSGAGRTPARTESRSRYPGAESLWAGTPATGPQSERIAGTGSEQGSRVITERGGVPSRPATAAIAERRVARNSDSGLLTGLLGLILVGCAWIPFSRKLHRAPVPRSPRRRPPP